MTAGPLAGPASAYPTFKAPASICFSEANEVLVPGLIAGNFVAPDCASAEPITPNWVAAMVMAAAPTKWRRGWSIGSELSGVSMMSLLGFDPLTAAANAVGTPCGRLRGVRIPGFCGPPQP